MAAADESRIQKLGLCLANPACLSSVQNVLDLLPDAASHERFVAAVVSHTRIIKIAGVDPLSQNFVKRGYGNLVPALAEAESFPIRLLCEPFQGVLPCRKPLEKTRHNRPKHQIGNDDALATLSRGVAVPGRRK